MPRSGAAEDARATSWLAQRAQSDIGGGSSTPCCRSTACAKYFPAPIPRTRRASGTAACCQLSRERSSAARAGCTLPRPQLGVFLRAARFRGDSVQHRGSPPLRWWCGSSAVPRAVAGLRAGPDTAADPRRADRRRGKCLTANAPPRTRKRLALRVSHQVPAATSTRVHADRASQLTPSLEPCLPSVTATPRPRQLGAAYAGNEAIRLAPGRAADYPYLRGTEINRIG